MLIIDEVTTMSERSVQYIGYVFPPYLQDDMVCVLCDGSHGNNSLCQMTTEVGGDDIH